MYFKLASASKRMPLCCSLQAESEYRHALLLKRAGQNFGTAESSRGAVTESDTPALEAAEILAKGM